MRGAFPVVTGACVLALGLTARTAGQDPPAPSAESTTLAGVYTPAQAARGEESYMNICVGCHSAGTYVGAQFMSKWDGRPLSELYEIMVEKMPKDDPGGLEPGEYAQILAFILRQNKMPAGKAELPADAAALKKVKFETPKGVASPATKGTTRWQE